LRACFLAPARQALDPGAQASAWAAGQALALDEAVATARTLLHEYPAAPA
jgi:hypothetical protein